MNLCILENFDVNSLTGKINSITVCKSKYIKIISEKNETINLIPVSYNSENRNHIITLQKFNYGRYDKYIYKNRISSLEDFSIKEIISHNTQQKFLNNKNFYTENRWLLNIEITSEKENDADYSITLGTNVPSISEVRRFANSIKQTNTITEKYAIYVNVIRHTKTFDHCYWHRCIEEKEI